MQNLFNQQLGCGCDSSQLYKPFKIMNVQSQIIDFDTNLPIPDVNVYLRHKPTTGTITNQNGAFMLEALPDDVVVMSHVQYGAIEVAAKDVMPTEYMTEQTNMLDETLVVVKKKKNWFLAAAAAVGLFIIVSNGDDEEKKKKPVKAKV